MSGVQQVAAISSATVHTTTLLSSGLTPTSNYGTVSGSLASLSDGLYSANWRSDAGAATSVSSGYIRYDLATAKTVTKAVVTPRGGITGNFRVSYSDDDVGYTNTATAFSSVAVSTADDNGVFSIASDAPGSHRYWRFVNTSNSVGTSDWGWIEVQLWGY